MRSCSKALSGLAAALAALLCLVASAAAGAPQEGLRFEHLDWELACDNTRTCRAVGYPPGEGTPGASILLLRQAGPHQALRGWLAFGDYDDTDRLPTQSPELWLDGQRIGPSPLEGELSPDQLTRLLPALLGHAVIEWREGKRVWPLSGRGAMAVLLKMDEFQGRLKTPGALVRPGTREESEVPPAVPAPVVIATKPVGGAGPLPSPTDWPDLKQSLIASLGEGQHCDCLTGEYACFDESPTFHPLDAQRTLVMTACFRGAYNFGEGAWVIQRQPPYQPVFVTDAATDYEDGMLSAAHKGRGLGDCWSQSAWEWDGKAFELVLKSRTGMCRLFAAGGSPWDLPTYVRTVKRR